MKKTLINKLSHLQDRLEELTHLLSSSEVINDITNYRELTKEHAELLPIVSTYREYQQTEADLKAAQKMLQDTELKELAEEEVQIKHSKLAELDHCLQILLLPKDEDDNKNIILEIRAGTGGDEASLFAGDLFRMYGKYAESKGWTIDIISINESEIGGYKEIIAQVKGKQIYQHLKFESGGHRVQRVPKTESQGRIHTSSCTVAVMPEADEIEEVELHPSDLKIDTFRASGAGGQHINKTDSAVRITHLPSGIVVECQDGRSQHSNKAQAMKVLAARLYNQRKNTAQAKLAADRKSLIGSGDRSERIRTYNFAQGRVTDHRINLTLYKLDSILEGELDELINPLLLEYQAEQLENLSELVV